MRTAEAMRRAGGDPREQELSRLVGSAVVGPRVLSLARAASAMHMALAAAERARMESAVGETVESAR